MIDPRQEKLLSIREAAKQIGYSINGVYRLIKEGSMGVDGKVHTLETFLTPTGMKTTIEAYYRFLETLNEC